MTRLKLLLSLFAGSSALIIAMFSCKKATDSTLSPSQSLNSITKAEWLYSGDINLIRPKIIDFISGAQHDKSNERTANDMLVEDGLGMLESALHLHFEDDRTTVRSHEIETAEIFIDLASPEVLSGQGIELAYIELVASISQRISAQKMLYLVDLEKIGFTPDQSKLIVRTDFIIGKKGLSLPSCFLNEEDIWQICCNAGKCDWTQTGRDATERLEELMNYGHCQPRCAGNSLEFWHIAQSRPFSYDDSQMGDLKWLKYVVNSSNLTCHTHSVMSSIKQILNDIVEVRKPGQKYVFVSIDIRDDEILNGTTLLNIEYNGRVFYVERYCLPRVDDN